MPLDLDWRMVDTAETSEVADMPEERRRQGELLDAFHGDGHDVLLFDDETPAPARESALAAPPR